MSSNILVIDKIEVPHNPKPCDPGCIRRLEAMPGYWRGRAATRRQLATTEDQLGNPAVRDRHLQEATKLESRAENCGTVAERALRRNL